MIAKKEKLNFGAKRENQGSGAKREVLVLALKKEAKIVGPAIKKLLNSYVSKKNRGLVNYPISSSGKRLRPFLAIISCRMLKGKTKDILYSAAGLEILHNYSLIIDDIIDNSKLRRGKPTAWIKFGKSIAQCVAIDWGAAVFQAANRSRNPVRISELLAKTQKAIVEGEILDILFDQAGREDEPYISKNRYRTVTQKDYLEMVNKKTAVLFQSSCEVGGICANANKSQLKALKNYGSNLGIAFQVQDDILDIFGEKTGAKKQIGQDIIERKLGNIVILFALQELSFSDKKSFLAILRKQGKNHKSIKKAIKLIEKTEAAKKACQFGKNFANKAKKNLLTLPKNKWRDLLETAADFALERKI